MKETISYNSDEFFNIITNSNPFEGKRVELQGTYRSAGADRYRMPTEIDGYLDMEKSRRIPMKFGDWIAIKGRPVNMDMVKFCGYIKYIDDKDDGIDNYYIFFFVTHISEIRHSQQAEKIIRIKSEIQKPEIKYIKEKIKGRRRNLNVAVIAPSKVAYYDVIEGMNGITRGMNIKMCVSPVFTAEEIIKIIRELEEEEVEIMCIERGGGAAFGALNNHEVIEAIARTKTYTIGAIGHAIDRNIFDLAFDEEVSTPSLLGVRLKEIRDEGAGAVQPPLHPDNQR